MAERGCQRDVSVEYTFDRLFTAKLQQVYEIVVPDRVRNTAGADPLTGQRHEERCDLRPSVLR